MTNNTWKTIVGIVSILTLLTCAYNYYFIQDTNTIIFNGILAILLTIQYNSD